jgi:hypothetical protein
MCVEQGKDNSSLKEAHIEKGQRESENTQE